MYRFTRDIMAPAHVVMVLVDLRRGSENKNLSISKLGLLEACFRFIFGPIYCQNCSFAYASYAKTIGTKRKKEVAHWIWRLEQQNLSWSFFMAM